MPKKAPSARYKRRLERWASSASKAAAACGVGRGTLIDWINQGCPGKQAGGYDIEAIRAWRAENKGEVRGVADNGETTDAARLKKAQADEREAKAALAVLQLAIQRGELLPIIQIKERDLARIAAVKRGLLALPKAMATRLVGLPQKEIEVALRTAVNELLQRFARM